MTLLDLRKAATKQNVRIRFRLRNGLDCVINERGVAEIPSLRAKPDFRLEDELAEAHEFHWEPHALTAGKNGPKPQRLDRDQLARLISPGADTAHDGHEDE